VVVATIVQACFASSKRSIAIVRPADPAATVPRKRAS
jgi:hypothetical protein